MRAGTLIGGCVAVLIALAVAAFLATHDRVDGQEWVGPSGEARLRPFLAAERFAERMGLKVSEVRALPELQTLAPRGALLVPNLRQEMHAGKLAELAAWASRGGHLIVEAEALGVPDPLLDQLGVARSQDEPIDKVFTVQPGFTVYLSEGMKLDAPQRDVRLEYLASAALGDEVVVRLAGDTGSWSATIGRRDGPALVRATGGVGIATD